MPEVRRGPRVAIAAFLLCAFTAPERFFPQVADVDPGHAAFREEWLGRPLRAMGEPIFSRLGPGANRVLRLRLLVRPDREAPYVIRIDEAADGRARLAIARLDGFSLRRRGRVVRQPDAILAAARLAPIHAALARAALPSLPVQGRERPPRMVNGMQELVLCAHSTYFLFELADATGLYQVDRDPCALEPRLAALAEALLDLNGDAPADDHAILTEASGVN